jgi:ABC-type glycerol-3-phosphate transport system permease component
MDNTARIVAISILILVGLIACLEAGFRLGRRNAASNPERAYEGIGAIEAAVFALLGLLLAFSLSGATSRLEKRRALIVQEANAIGTAYLRLDLLPPAEQPAMRQLFREYLDLRIGVYEAIADTAASARKQLDAVALQQEIWTRAISATGQGAEQPARLLLLPAMNEMIDVTTTRAVALNTHLPSAVAILLVAITLLSGVVAGYAMSRRGARSWLHLLLYAVVVGATLYMVLDLEYPRSGLIRLDAADTALYKLRDSIR